MTAPRCRFTTKGERNRQEALQGQEERRPRTLDNAVVAEGAEDVCKLAGLGRPDIGIFSYVFLKEARDLPQCNFAVELLQKLLNDEIKSRSRTK